MGKALTATVLVSSQSVSAGGTVRGRVDVSNADGGIVTMRITNGATGPSTQCVGRVLIAHKQTSMPAAASEGTGDNDWKKVYEFGNGFSASASSSMSWRFGREVAYVEVEFTGHTGQAVTVESHCTSHVQA